MLRTCNLNTYHQAKSPVTSLTPSPDLGKYHPYNPMNIHVLPNPASEEDIARYIEIRLSSLLTNPEAFGSSYKRESAFTLDQWHGRVNSVGGITLVVSDPGSSVPTTSFPDELPMKMPQETNWMGTLKVLSPEMLSSLPGNFGYPPDIADAENAGEAEVWILVAMWVRPTCRVRGVGRDLVEKALEVVRNSKPTTNAASPMNESGPREIGSDRGGGLETQESQEIRRPKERIILLQVEGDNFPARKLYEKAGFRTVPEFELGGQPTSAVETAAREQWMAFHIRYHE